MAQVKKGDTVKINYRGLLDDGTLFDANEEGESLEVKVGEGNLIPGIESALEGMSVGDTKKISLVAEEAYGPYRDDLCIEIDRDRLDAEIKIEVGQPVQIKNAGEINVVGHFKEVKEETVVVDANHPLAGKNLTFHIELVEIS